MQGSDATQPKEPVQRPRCFATVAAVLRNWVFQVGFSNFEIVLRCDLHSRETVPPVCTKRGVSNKQFGGRASTRSRCDFPTTFQAPKRPRMKSAGDGKSSAMLPLHMRATSAAYS